MIFIKNNNKNSKIGYYIRNSTKLCKASNKNCQSFALKCVLKTLTNAILTHPSHLTVDMSHTHAPPHLVKALHCDDRLVLGVCKGFQKRCACA